MFFDNLRYFTKSLLFLSLTLVSVFFGSLGVGGFALFSTFTFIFSVFGYLIFCIREGPFRVDCYSPARDLYLIVVHGVISFISICLYVTWDHDKVQHMKTFAEGWQFFEPFKYYIVGLTILVAILYSFLCHHTDQNDESE